MHIHVYVFNVYVYTHPYTYVCRMDTRENGGVNQVNICTLTHTLTNIQLLIHTFSHTHTLTHTLPHTHSGTHTHSGIYTHAFSAWTRPTLHRNTTVRMIKGRGLIRGDTHDIYTHTHTDGHNRSPGCWVCAVLFYLSVCLPFYLHVYDVFTGVSPKKLFDFLCDLSITPKW